MTGRVRNFSSAAFGLLFGVASGAGSETRNHAVHSEFSMEQIVEHLGLDGGNWTIEFEKPVFLGFVIATTENAGPESHEEFWSPSASRIHDFHFKHHVLGEAVGDHERLHQFEFGSEQRDDSKSMGPLSISTTMGVGFAYNQFLPRSGRSSSAPQDFFTKLDTPRVLFEFESADGTTNFRVEVIFSAEKPEEE